MSAPEIACWFDFASNYSYLSVLRLARQRDVIVHWKPFLLGPIFKEQGWDNSPFVLQQDKGDYVWKDMPRECAKYELPWRRPSEFPRRSLLAARVALLGEHQPWMAEFCARVMLANFEHDEDIGNEDVIAAILTGIGLDAGALLAAAHADDNKARLRARSAEAKALRIFGAPTFFVDTEMYWGNDRLADALALAKLA
ncbi:2-hydroxychromene-2-carboxylate isomerase [Duganella sp. FT50W]|uniref:2-hydroxychromene-2-carboxylate isomerase n=1 Tax=Duganella lactea TaxID=2692173 RepID=A0A6L8MQZ7_9BURK|nr:2-hydroxychromene-2-carboxylate isomerase [Duganella lactea]MYM83838.1 2-hydroxychromene-2-carboxylate isomerase [Duganella lactea]